jgi:hypothetical protein
MDDEDAGAQRALSGEECRSPTQADLVALCRELNRLGARYVVVGGFAVIEAGFPRMTADLDLVVAADAENEANVFRALASLPDHAALELQPGELQLYGVIRVADEIVVDLMRSAGGIEYAEAAAEAVVREVEGVPIPFASPRLLWRMKAVTRREKDALDLVFLRQWFVERGQEPPVIGGGTLAS